MKIFISIIGVIILLFIVITFIFYGTISPCEILKKEVAMQGGGGYVLFGGLINNGIDTLTPLECLNGFYEIKINGIDAMLDKLMGK